MKLIYLDNNATTRPAPEVIDAMLPFLRDSYGNPSSLHRLGQASRHAIDEARSQVAALIGAATTEITFTSGGSESVNTALHGLFTRRHPRKRILTSTVEHSATRGTCAALKRHGAEVETLPVSTQGELDLDALKAALHGDPAFVSLLWANNETGVLFQIEEIVRLCRDAGVPLHCDGTQAVGKIPVDVHTLGVDLLSFAAHKFHGPKGVGGLYTRRGLRMESLIAGGPQESSRRGGTENVPGIVGMGAAANLAAAALPHAAAIRQRRDRLEQGILTAVPETAVNGAAAPRLPNTANIGFARLEAEAILLLLSERGVCASAGAACSSGSLEPSHVLQAMHIHPHFAHGSVRFSLSRYTTDEEIEATLEIVPQVVARLREVLPV